MSVTRNLAKHIGIATLRAFACGMTHAEDLASLVIAKQGYFFVGGTYVDTPNGPVVAGNRSRNGNLPTNP